MRIMITHLHAFTTRRDDSVLVLVSSWSTLRMLTISVCQGIWLCTKRAVQKVIQSQLSLKLRDTPPACLVDSSFGRHSYVKLRGTKLHYVEAGKRNMPLVLLLHGFPDCWLGWRFQIPVLSKHFRVIALDLKGFGDSDKPAWRRQYRPSLILKEVRGLLEALGEKSCILIGHDLGALIGWLLVHTSPDLVDRFVAVSSPHPNIYWDSIPRTSLFNNNWLHIAQLPYLPEIDALRGDLHVIEQSFKHLNQKSDVLQAYKYTFSRKEDWVGPLNYYRNLPYVRVDEKAPKINIPTLFITGNKDSLCNLESIVKSSEWCENSLVKIIEGSCHWPHQDNPDAVNKLLLSFLVAPINHVVIADPSPSKSLMGRVLGAVSSTVKYGGDVIDSVQKKPSGLLESIGFHNRSVAK